MQNMKKKTRKRGKIDIKQNRPNWRKVNGEWIKVLAIAKNNFLRNK